MRIRRWTVICLACGLLAAYISAFTPARAAAAAAPGTLTDILAAKYAQDSYHAYRGAYETAPAAVPVLTLGVGQLSPADSRGIEVVQSGPLAGAAVRVLADGRAVFEVPVPAAGLYGLRLSYAYTDTAELKNSDLAVRIDGKLPFAEAGRLALPRLWTQEELVHRDQGNDYTPRTLQTLAPGLYTAADETGLEGDYLFFLGQGTHQLSLESAAGGFEIAEVRLGSPALPSDAACRAQARGAYSGRTYTRQAEELFRTNDSSITCGVDRTDAGVVPNDPVFKKINVLDGSKFAKPQQTASWRFAVEAAGRYRIGIQFKQDSLQGMFVTRRLLLDGEPVCAGLSNLRFGYADGWQYQVLAAQGEPLILDLEAGEHTLALEVTLGDLRPYVRRMDEMVFALNYLYRKIIMLTGTSPDPLRDYDLAAEIPYLVPDFTAIRQELTDIYAGLQGMGIQGGQVSILTQLAAQLASFIDDPYTIQNRLANYKSNISALSSLIMALQEQPLTIDYLSLLGTAEGDTARHSGLFDQVWFQLRAFLGSFTCDYTSIGDSGDTADSGSLRVWFSGGREQAELLKDIIDERFAAVSGVGVNLQLVSISLSQAVLAGTAPDVALTTARSQPVNLGARGVLADLSAFDGFDELRQVFGETLMAPYSYRGRVFALPVTLDYHMLFYRQDILEELGLSLPHTWDDLYAMIPILQRSNMAIGLPYTVLSSQATIESGIGAKDLFATLVLQRGCDLYEPDGTAIRLETPEIAAAFKQWTDFYTQYQLDLEYSFYNRFRTGEMPLAIQSYGSYNLLAAAAPEIRGLWGMTTVPGTRRADGKVDRTEAASGSGAVMLKDCADPAAAWSFIRWWVSADAQSAYGNALEVLMGKASRYNPANPQAMQALPWDDAQLAVLMDQRACVREVPEVLGGYYTVRGLDNAFRNVVFSSRNYKEALTEQAAVINAELARKQQEFASVPF